MANISILARLINGATRNVDLSTNTLVVDILKVGGGSGSDLTKAILDKLILIQAAADVDGTFDSRYTQIADLASTDAGKGASDVGIQDSGAYFTGTSVEAALQELGAAVGSGSAADISYDNVASGLAATDVQAAIDEVEGRLETAEADVVAAQGDATQALSDAAAAQADATQALSDAESAQVSADAASAAALDAQNAADAAQADATQALADASAAQSDATQALADAAAAQADVDQEILDRQAADTALQNAINAISSSLQWRSMAKAATGDAGLNAAANDTALSSLLPFSDDDAPEMVIGDFAAGDYLLSKNGASSKIFIIWDDAGTLKVTDVGVAALAAGDTFMVANDLPDTPANQESQAIYTYTGTDIIKVGDFDWSLATGIDLSGSFVSTTGVVAAGDSVEAAIAKLVGNLADAQADATQALADAAAAQADVDALDTRVDTAEADIATLQSAPAGLTPVRFATTGNLSATYSNGASGVGATLTSTTMVALSIESQQPAVGNKILVKNQASTFQNGVYEVTVAGSGAANWVLTRVASWDQPAELLAGKTVVVVEGTVNGDTMWTMQADITTVGTTAVTFQSTGFNYQAMPQVMLPATAQGTNIGSTPLPLGLVYALQHWVSDGTNVHGHLGGNVTMPGSGSSALGITSFSLGATPSALGIITSAGTGTNPSSAIRIESGNSVNGNSGNIQLRVGVPSGSGVRGKIVLDGLEIDASSKKIVSLADGTNANDAVNKSQLDTKQAASANLDEADTFFGATNLTGAEAETLSNGSNADDLHIHAKLREILSAGEAYSAGVLVAVRWAKAADAGFVAGRMYKADNDASSADNFYVAGLAVPVGALSAGQSIHVIKSGLITATAHGFTVGQPLFLDAAGAVTETAPTDPDTAVVRVGMVRDANNIEVQIQVIGIN